MTFAVTPYTVANRGGASVSETRAARAALGRAHDLEAPLDEAFSERDDVGDEQPGRAVRPSFP